MKFDYRIISVDQRGYAQVLYSNKELGETRVFMYLPIEKGDEAVDAEVLVNLPRQWFRAKRRALSRQSADLAAKYTGATGTLTATIEDSHHDFQTGSVVSL